MEGMKRAADTARIIRSGDTQVVELPSGYEFETGEVSIRREGRALILEPVKRDWDWLQGQVRPFDEDVIAALDEPVPPQDRPELDGF